jgi:cyclohexanone monooxygenase
VATVDKEALKQKYAEERDKRLRPEGNEQYVRIEGTFDEYLEDPYLPVVPRNSKTDHVTVAIIGGGFAGLVTGVRLKEAGITDVRMIEKGGDFGGTWYWNRYPGAQCDTTSFIYMPLLEETGHMPTEKYVHGPEILEHSRRIGRQFGLYDDALFHTRVTELEWDARRSRWIIRTDRGDAFTAQFVSMGTGPLHVPKLPGIPGIESFRGRAFHTSRWDYEYTGGDANGARMDKLADKRVAVIGTGATAVQVVPNLAPVCKKLYVFQRTPSSVDVRDNRPTDPEWFKEFATPGWQQRWLDNFAAVQTGMMPDEDMTQDGWTDIARRVRSRIMELPADQWTPEGMLRAFEDSDFEKMEEIRARADAIVTHAPTAQKLKAWYRQLCKRPCFHDEYLQAFNEPSTELVDTDGKGVERITEKGVVVAGVEYEVDCIIYASGFEVGTAHTRRMGFDVIGRDGLRLSDYWREGMRTKHGMFVHGFPNMFIVQVQHGANLISNVPHNLTEAGKTIAMILQRAQVEGATEVEVTKQAENDWMELLNSGPGTFFGSTECTPGYYNGEGQPTVAGRDFTMGFPLGSVAYFEYQNHWRSSGKFEGLEFRRDRRTQ